MKFLFFNLVVIVALVYLFVADRRDFHATADHLFDTVEEVKSKAAETIENAKAEHEKDRQPTISVLDQSDVDAPPSDTDANHNGGVEAYRELASDIAQPYEESDTPASQDHRLPATQLPPVDDPDVARRRAEVLDGIGVPEYPRNVPAKVVLAEGEKLMSPGDRRRELYALAEEMELLFLDQLSR